MKKINNKNTEIANKTERTPNQPPPPKIAPTKINPKNG